MQITKQKHEIDLTSIAYNWREYNAYNEILMIIIKREEEEKESCR